MSKFRLRRPSDSDAQLALRFFSSSIVATDAIATTIRLVLRTVIHRLSSYRVGATVGPSSPIWTARGQLVAGQSYPAHVERRTISRSVARWTLSLTAALATALALFPITHPAETLRPSR